MTCYHPLHGYRSQEVTKNGKRKLTFSTKYGYADLPQTVACGQCIGCRLERSRQWALRCIHEAQLHAANCFITLTYHDDHLPPGRTLVKNHFQKFIRALRKKYGSVRYFHCGEYGDIDRRPHYHALLFGFDFPDKKFHSRNELGDDIFKSESLEKLWGKGFCTIGRLNYQTAAYTARYILKKVNGELSDEHYKNVCTKTGEVFDIQPEYITMSLKPAIGFNWFEKYQSDCFPSDFLTFKGKRMAVPRYYTRHLEKIDPDGYRKVKSARIRSAAKHKADQTPERLRVREEVKLSKIKTLSRKL